MIGPLNTAFSLSFTIAMSEAAVASMLWDPSGNLIRKLGKFWGARMCHTCGIELNVEGGERIDWNQPLVVMANHQSLFDIPVLYAALPRPFGMLAKQELFRFPVFRSAMAGLGCVPIDRGNRRQSFASLRAAAERVRAGSSIVVFPEGTRSEDGRIRPLKKGPFHLVEMAGVPIVPVGIRGTRDALAKDGLLVHAARVRVRIGEALAASRKGQTARDALRENVRDALVELTGLARGPSEDRDPDAG
jgi:1-acyl-sn-glycerol-3-phosphate acyltransferase